MSRGHPKLSPGSLCAVKLRFPLCAGKSLASLRREASGALCARNPLSGWSCVAEARGFGFLKLLASLRREASGSLCARNPLSGWSCVAEARGFGFLKLGVTHESKINKILYKYVNEIGVRLHVDSKAEGKFVRANCFS